MLSHSHHAPGRRVQIDGVGQWLILVRAELPAVMTAIGGHEDEAVRSRASEAHHVSNSVSRAVQKVKRTVPKIVEGIVLAQPQTCPREIHLDQFATSVIDLLNPGVWVGRVSGEELVLETLAHDQLG